MNNHSPEDLLKFGELDFWIIVELLRRSFVDSNLTEMEQLVFGLRYGLINAEVEDRPTKTDELQPLDIPAVVKKIDKYFGEPVSSDTVSNALEKAEAKTSRFIWEAVNAATRAYLDRTT